MAARNDIETVPAEATKGFFVHMLTKDILLQDCVLDLADNSVDGANRVIARRNKPLAEEARYAGFQIDIAASKDGFSIQDNCGGISLDLARRRVFFMGKPQEWEGEKLEHGIGLYGIGMKRALFKMGPLSAVESSTDADAFRVIIDVDEWLRVKEWTFRLEKIEKFAAAGTKIHVKVLNEETALQFSDPAFLSKLKVIIARDYSFVLQKGMSINVNGHPVVPYNFALRIGEEVRPIHEAYEDGGVKVTISAGLAHLPDDNPDPDSERSEADYYGWFVVCNDRVVVAADKSNKTVWGDEAFAVWHPQYNGFMGLVNFECDDPGKLPWSTTKRDVDKASPVYLRAIAKMKVVTRQYTTYSNTRKAALADAKAAEARSKPVSVKELTPDSVMKLPAISPVQSAYITVTYQALKTDIKKAAVALGRPSLPATHVGRKTFEYFMRNEL